jgi:hypothetical protein
MQPAHDGMGAEAPSAQQAEVRVNVDAILLRYTYDFSSTKEKK